MQILEKLNSSLELNLFLQKIEKSPLLLAKTQLKFVKDVSLRIQKIGSVVFKRSQKVFKKLSINPAFID